MFTVKKNIILNISNKDSEKISILEYLKCPFFILSFNDIEDEIKVEDSFEISNDEFTLNLECEASCGLRKSRN